MDRVVSEILLRCQEGTADKEYRIQTVEAADGTFAVLAANCRRGQAWVDQGAKAQGVGRDVADKKAASLAKSKVGKGYQVVSAGGTGVALVQASKADPAEPLVRPQLLCPIQPEEADPYLDSWDWTMEEKHDGHRQTARKVAQAISAYNKKGTPVSLDGDVAQAVGTFSGDALMDGEQVRSRYSVFDLMELNGRDLRPMPYLQRRAFLEALVASGSQSLVEVVPTMNDPALKRAELERLRKAGAEGVVFKRIHPLYQPGRPASGGDQVKLKFYETLSVVVLAVNDKRSVQMGVYPAPADHPRAAGMPPKFQGPAEVVIPVGNVTIPANHTIPKVGTIAEIRYLYAYPNGSIYQPTHLGERTDVDAPECHAAQLKFRVIPDGDEEEEDLAS